MNPMSYVAHLSSRMQLFDETNGDDLLRTMYEVDEFDSGLV